jgi:hypothetical protein
MISRQLPITKDSQLSRKSQFRSCATKVQQISEHAMASRVVLHPDMQQIRINEFQYFFDTLSMKKEIGILLSS